MAVWFQFLDIHQIIFGLVTFFAGYVAGSKFEERRRKQLEELLRKYGK